MFCRNCGKEMDDSMAFCPVCGTGAYIDANNTANVQVNANQNINQNGNVTNYQATTPVENATTVAEAPVYPAAGPAVVPKPKKSRKKLWITLIASLLGVGLLVFGFFELFGYDFFNRMFMSPEDYLVHVIEKNASKSGARADEILGFIQDGDHEGTYKSKMSLQFTDGYKKLMEEEYYDASGVTWFDNIDITCDATISDVSADAVVNGKVDGVDITTATGTFDGNAGGVYLNAPDINPSAIGAVEDDVATVMRLFKKIRDEEGVFDDDDLIEDMITRYYTIMAEQITIVGETREDVVANNVEETQTVLTVTIDGTTYRNMINAFTNEAMSDKVLEDIIRESCRVLGEDENKAMDDFRKELNRMRDSASRYSDNYKSQTFKIYVNDDGEIVGYSKEEKYSKTHIFYTRSFSEYGFEFYESMDWYKWEIDNGYGKNADPSDKNESYIRGNGEISILGNMDGVFNIGDNRNGTYATITVEELDLGALEDLGINGKIIIDTNPGKEYAVKVEIEGSQDSFKDGEIKFTVSSNGTVYVNGTYGIDFDEDDLTVDKPTSYIDGDDYDQQIKWKEKLTLGNILSKLESAGMPEFVGRDIEEGIEWEIEEYKRYKNNRYYY